MFNFPGTLGLYRAEGMDDLIIKRGGEVEFTGRIECGTYIKEKVISQFKERKIMFQSATIDGVTLKPGGEIEKVRTHRMIKCVVGVN